MKTTIVIFAFAAALVAADDLKLTNDERMLLLEDEHIVSQAQATLQQMQQKMFKDVADVAAAHKCVGCGFTNDLHSFIRPPAPKKEEKPAEPAKK